MKNVIVIGGAGFVGSHLVDRLLVTPGVERVMVYDNMSNAAKGPDQPIVHLIADAKDLPMLRAAMTDCDTVFHLAANPDISKAVKQPTIDFDEGTLLTQNVLEAMRMNGITRLFYASGSGVYGDHGERALREDMACAPISTYGASKLASEAMISAYSAMFGIQALNFRPANIVGPFQTHGVGYDFIRQLKAHPDWLRILGDGKQSKSYIHISDVVWAIVELMQREISGIFNICAEGDYLDVTTIAMMAVEVMGLDCVRFDYTGGDRGWKGDVPVVRFDCTKLGEISGCRPEYDSATAMRLSLEAMKQELNHS